jgi:hypothetical protein
MLESFYVAEREVRKIDFFFSIPEMLDFFPCSSLSPNHLQLVDFSSFYEVISIANPIDQTTTNLRD